MYSERIHKAVMFATKAHIGQTRKSNDIPYIYHPMEVLQILTEMDCDEVLRILLIVFSIYIIMMEFYAVLLLFY